MKQRTYWMASVAAMTLAACGGGGEPAPPTATVSPDVTTSTVAVNNYLTALTASTDADTLEPVPVPDSLATSDTAEPAPVN